MTEAIDLRGQVAVVTGGTRGIGLACAEKMASAGADVVLAGHQNLQRAEWAASKLAGDHNVRAVGLLADSSDPEAIRNLYKQVRSEFGKLDILVNNAGILQDALLGMISDEQIEQTMRVNSFALIHHLQAASRLMRKRGGAIINMTSIIARSGNPGQVVYGASKAAVIGMTYSAAKELAPKNIRVNAIAPGFIDTDMTKALSAETYSQRIQSIGMGRIGTSEDVAKVVLFMASDYSAYVTGQVVGVDGGMLI